MTGETGNLDSIALIAAAVALTAGAITAAILVRSLMRLANHPPAAMIVVSLALLTLIALIGALATDNAEIGTIAAAGVGALAGAVTAMYGRNRDTDQEG